ncbi:hypothetical protein IAT38_005690 [Cryptococcus sp. DSM 104549]
MGAQSSKGIRKLPKSSLPPRSAPGSAARAAPFAPPPVEDAEEAPPSTFDYGGVGRSGQKTSGANDEATGEMGKIRFSGEKDEAVIRDAMDPQFMRNLHRLGPVEIHEAGEFVPALAQKTLASRRADLTSSSSIAPPGYLTFPFLESLLDQLKTLPPGADPSKVYKRFGVEREKVDELRKWVNSVSISDEDTVWVEDGLEKREMNAVWIGGPEK